jgi:SAM-dependent methyltransferase
MLKQRKYDSYDEYIKHQTSKTDNILKSESNAEMLSKWNAKYYSSLKESIGKYSFDKGTSVLCLGARQGGEVQAFIDSGCFAVGLDLLPTPENKYVVHGDFNNIQYADCSVDVVFTNSLDHAKDIKIVAEEICRVLKSGGRFIVEVLPDGHGNAKDRWACCWWDLFSGHGFVLESKTELKNRSLFGTQLCFMKNREIRDGR